MVWCGVGGVVQCGWGGAVRYGGCDVVHNRRVYRVVVPCTGGDGLGGIRLHQNDVEGVSARVPVYWCAFVSEKE